VTHRPELTAPSDMEKTRRLCSNRRSTPIYKHTEDSETPWVADMEKTRRRPMDAAGDRSGFGTRYRRWWNLPGNYQERPP